MHMLHYVTITSQGQITIPSKLRQKLNLRKNSLALVQEKDKKLIIEPVPDILELRGIFKSKKKIPWKKIRQQLDDAWASGLI